MAFKSQDLSVIAYANGFTLWHYSTIDLASGIDTNGYFNSASDMLRIGDVIFANTDTDGSPATGILNVSANNLGVVDVADMTQIGTLNTD